MLVPDTPLVQPLTVNGVALKQVKSFTYLGIDVFHSEVTFLKRRAKAWTAANNLYNEIKSVLLYGSEAKSKPNTRQEN